MVTINTGQLMFCLSLLIISTQHLLFHLNPYLIVLILLSLGQISFGLALIGNSFIGPSFIGPEFIGSF